MNLENYERCREHKRIFKHQFGKKDQVALLQNTVADKLSLKKGAVVMCEK